METVQVFSSHISTPIAKATGAVLSAEEDVPSLVTHQVVRHSFPYRGRHALLLLSAPVSLVEMVYIVVCPIPSPLRRCSCSPSFPTQAGRQAMGKGKCSSMLSVRDRGLSRLFLSLLPGMGILLLLLPQEGRMGMDNNGTLSFFFIFHRRDRRRTSFPNGIIIGRRDGRNEMGKRNWNLHVVSRELECRSQ